MKPHELERSFLQFSLNTIYHLTFFSLITTIGLNIIFGIIVDTFSELRDIQWQAASDMKQVCFICGRDSYEFESLGQVGSNLDFVYYSSIYTPYPNVL